MLLPRGLNKRRATVLVSIRLAKGGGRGKGEAIVVTIKGKKRSESDRVAPTFVDLY